jgi:hypothetical protein
MVRLFIDQKERRTQNMTATKFMKLGILLWIFFKWEWKVAKFTGAWVFIIPIVVSALSGTPAFVNTLALLCTVFCVGYTIRSIIRRQAHKQAPAYAPAPAPQMEQGTQGGIFFGNQE